MLFKQPDAKIQSAWLPQNGSTDSSANLEFSSCLRKHLECRSGTDGVHSMFSGSYFRFQGDEDGLATSSSLVESTAGPFRLKEKSTTSGLLSSEFFQQCVTTTTKQKRRWPDHDCCYYYYSFSYYYFSNAAAVVKGESSETRNPKRTQLLLLRLRV